jgi:hypothetical protein
MARLHRLLEISTSEVFLLGSTLTLIWIIRIGLWVIPFPRMRRLVSTATARARSNRAASEVNVGANLPKSFWQLVWAIGVVSRWVPQATCLTQALAAQVLLARAGHKATVHIGVAKDVSGKFEAHAWVEAYGRVVIGGAPDSHWTPLMTL